MKRHLSRIWLLGAVVAVLGIVALQAPTPAAAANLLANPGFEDGGGSYNGWFTFGSGVQLSLPAGDNIIHDGVAASKIYGGFVGCPGAPQFNVGGYGQAFTPTAGHVYEFSGFSFVSRADSIPGTDTCNKNRCLAKIAFFDATSGGNEIASNEVVIGDGNSVLNHWRGFSVSAPAPAAAQRVEALILFLQPACDGGSVFVDDCSFSGQAPAAEPNLLTNPSFTAGLTGWSTFGNVFTESRSYLVRTPSGSAKLFSTFVAGSPSGMFQSFPASPGTAWRLDAYSLNTCRENPINGTNDNFVLGRIVFRDAGNNEIGGTDVLLLDKTQPLGTWTRHSALATNAPAGTVTVQAYILFISPSLLGGAAWIDDVSFQSVNPTGVVDVPKPSAFRLAQNAPNPFGLSTRIEFSLDRPDVVDLTVYDVLGRRIASLVQGPLGPGPHEVTWNGEAGNGAPVASGIYRYVLRTSSGKVSRSMMLVR